MGVEDAFEGFLGFWLFVAEIDEGEHDVVGGGVAGGGWLGWGGGVFPCGGDADLVFEFEDDAFGGFFADPADFGEGGGVAADDVAFEVGDAHAAEDGEAHFGSDAGDALHEEAEEIAFVVGGEAVEGLFLFADVEVDEEFDRLACGREFVVGADGDEDLVADAGDVDGDAVREAFREVAAQEGDHEGLLAEREAFCKLVREPGGADFALSGFDVVGDAADGDLLIIVIVEGVGAAPVAVSGLADAADVDEVLAAGVDAEGFRAVEGDAEGFDVEARGVGVAEEADGSELVAEAGHGVEAVHDVGPAGGGVEGGVDDGEVADLADHAEVAEPVFVFLGELTPGPFEGGVGEGVEADDFGGGASFLVVIAFYDRAAEFLETCDALVGVGVVADDVADADELVSPEGLRIFHDGIEGLEVRMDVSEDSEFHVLGTGKRGLSRERGGAAMQGNFRLDFQFAGGGRSGCGEGWRMGCEELLKIGGCDGGEGFRGEV